MSHELENNNDMIYTNSETPWHQLGENFPDGISLEDLKQHPCLNWSVKLEQLYMDNATAVNRKAVVRSDTGAVLGTVGTSYLPIQNSANLDWFEPYLNSGEVEISTAGTIHGGRRVWILAKIKNMTVDVAGTDDPYMGYLLASNGHDGTCSQRLGFTAVRVVCSNTMTAAHGSGKFLKIRHTEGALTAMEDVRSVMDLQRQNFDIQLSQLRELSKHGVRAGDVPALIAASFATDSKKRAKLLEDAIVGRAAGALANATDTQSADFQALLARPRGATDFRPIVVDADDDATDVGRLARAIVPIIASGRGNDRDGYRGTALGVYSGISEYITHSRGHSVDNRLESQWFGGGSKVLDNAQSVLREYSERVVMQ